MHKLPQLMINVRVKERKDPMSIEAVREAVSVAEKQLAGQGRVLLRPSGTEPVIRVMAEGRDAALVEGHAGTCLGSRSIHVVRG